MRITVDPDVCQGHTLCAMNAPKLFDLSDEDGHAVVLVEDVPVEHEAAARLAAAGCPERAIAITE